MRTNCLWKREKKIYGWTWLFILFTERWFINLTLIFISFLDWDARRKRREKGIFRREMFQNAKKNTRSIATSIDGRECIKKIGSTCHRHKETCVLDHVCHTRCPSTLYLSREILCWSTSILITASTHRRASVFVRVMWLSIDHTWLWAGLSFPGNSSMANLHDWITIKNTSIWQAVGNINVQVTESCTFEWCAERISRCDSLCKSMPDCMRLDISIRRYRPDQQWASPSPNTCGRNKRQRSVRKENASAGRCCNRFLCIPRVNCGTVWERRGREEHVGVGSRRTSGKQHEQRRSPVVTKREVHRVSNGTVSYSEWSPADKCRRSGRNCPPYDAE